MNRFFFKIKNSCSEVTKIQCLAFFENSKTTVFRNILQRSPLTFHIPYIFFQRLKTKTIFLINKHLSCQKIRFSKLLKNSRRIFEKSRKILDTSQGQGTT